MHFSINPWRVLHIFKRDNARVCVCVRAFVRYAKKSTFSQQEHIQIFPIFLAKWKRERDPKNILYYQRNVENLTDQVLDFLLFDKDEYTDGIFGL